MGWMVLAVLAGLLVYFQVSISDPAAKKRAVFKTFIGIGTLLFIAIPEQFMVRIDFAPPVSLVMITGTAFIMACFTNLALS